MLVSEQVRHKILTNIQINSESNPEGDLQVYLANKYATSLQRDALKSNMEQFFAVYSTPDAEKMNGCCEAHTPKISNRVSVQQVHLDVPCQNCPLSPPGWPLSLATAEVRFAGTYLVGLRQSP